MNVSIVIVEYHSLSDLRECVNSIFNKVKKLNFEIIVSSNSSYAKPAQQQIQNEFLQCKWIFNEKNLGFAKAINKGIATSTGECIIIMNSDVRLLNGHLDAACQYLTADPMIGMIGPKIVDGNGDVQDSCRKMMTISDLFIRLMKRIFLRKDVLLNPRFNYDRIQPVDWVIGSFIIAKREAVRKVGALDDGYFLYVEDMDWCLRFWHGGFEVVYYPPLVVQYKGDRKSISPLISKRFDINKYSYYHAKSYLRFVKKHYLLKKY